jgi:predicted permease
MPDAERVGRVYLRRPNADGSERIDNNISYLRYTDLRDATRAFASTAAIYQDENRIVGTGAAAEALGVGLVSATFWGLFDVRPVLGRFFSADEDRVPNGTDVVVLGYGYWQSRFGGDAAALGKPLRIGSRTFTIIGVTPKGFHGVWPTATAAYVPITAAAYDMFGSDRYYLDHGASWLEMIGRLRPGVSFETASAELTTAFRQSRLRAASVARPPQTIPPSNLALTRGELAPLPMDRGPKASDSAKVARWLAGVAVVVLLIACANVANLLIARGIRRRREIAVRVALGVSRGRLIAQLLTESVLIALLGGALGLVLAHFGGGAIRALLLPNVDWTAVPAFDARVLLFTAGAAVLTGLVTGLIPAAHALGADVNSALKAGEREGGGQRARVRTTLLLAQAGLSVVLLVGATLFVRSLRNVQQLDLGWDAKQVLLVGLDVRGVKLGPEELRALRERVIDRVRAMPGIVSASTLFSVPFQSTWSDAVFVPGMDSAAQQRTYVINPVGDQYFETIGTRILRGRAVGESDPPKGPLVAVISDRMGKLLWPGKDPIGQCFRLGADTAPCREVVGVAEDITFGDIKNDETLQLYLPSSQERNGGWIVARVAGDPRLQLEPLRRQIQALLPGMGFTHVRPIDQVLDPVMRQWRLGATMFTIFGAIALLLAAVGLYGVIAYDIAQRMREMGVRVALGAQAADIRRLVVWQGIRVAAVGAVLGMLVAAFAVKYVADLLFHTSAYDPVAFGGAALLILIVAIVATLLPARRAMKVDPVVALRSE